MTRAIAALIVFLVPTFISLSLKVIDWGKAVGKKEAANSLSQCWEANYSCSNN